LQTAASGALNAPHIPAHFGVTGSNWNWHGFWRVARSVLATVLISTILVFAIEWVTRGALAPTIEFFLQPHRPGWTTIVVLSLVLIALDALLGRRHNSLLIIAPFALTLAFIGRQKVHYLGDPLYPTDILYARQIMELMPLLVRERPWVAVAMAAGALLAFYALYRAWRWWRRARPISMKSRIMRLVIAVPALAFFVSIMDYATFSWVRDRLQIIPVMWDQKENYASNGFAIAFALNVPMAKVGAPPLYNDEVMANIAPRPGPNALAMPAEKPDVIMVMSESFWDPTLLPNTKFTPGPDPDRARDPLRLHVFPGIRRHDRQCRVRGADRLFERLPSLWLDSLSAICARADALASDLLPLARLRDDRHPPVRRLVLEPQARL
jgi:phosphoglycerol transferase MdoB-like AlkP superfamily enzyme